MSSQLRYRTLVTNISRIYGSESAKLLQDALLEIAATNAERWDLIKADSDRLLTVWCAIEDYTVANIVATQILDILNEFDATPVSVVLASPAHAAICSAPAPPPVAPSPTLVVTDKIAHVHPSHFTPSYEDEKDEKVVVVKKEEESEEEEEEESEVEVEVEAEEEKEETEAEEEEEEEEVEVEEEEKEEESEIEVEEEEKEAEVVEPEEEKEEAEEEEEEEAGMEVEQVTIRGRAYWLDSNTNKLYANVSNDEDDEVGDEVGAMVNGKPVFLAK